MKKRKGERKLKQRKLAGHAYDIDDGSSIGETPRRKSEIDAIGNVICP